MPQSVLVIDDDPLIRDLLSLLLQEEGYLVHCAATGGEGLEAVQQQQPDLVVLDIDLPDTTGLAVCKKIRKDSRMPIIMLSAKDQELDKVVGMEFGADDYVGKPCNPKELVARVRAQLRRWSQWQTPKLHSGQLETREATILFALLGNETSFDSTPLEELTAQILQFQEIFEPIISSHGGRIDSYSEDTAVAIFAEGAASRSAADACRAASVLQHGLAKLQALPTHLGLHTGALVVADVSLGGTPKPALVGEEARKAATIARVAQKLEVPVLASPATVAAAGSEFVWDEQEEHPLKDAGAPVRLFQPAD